MNADTNRLAIAALSAAGILDSLYMLAYEEGLIDSLICPFFGEGCNIVGRSEHAKHFGIPNALAGAVGYGIMTALALWPQAERQVWHEITLSSMAAAAAAAGAFLTWEQKSKVHAFCFWCLLSTTLSFTIAPLAMADLKDALNNRQTHRGNDDWNDRHLSSHIA